MAELIKKQTLLDWVQKQIESVTKKQVAGSDGIFTREVLTTMQRDISTFENEINAVATVTEAEIRAKAIEEFYDKVLNFEDYIEPKAQIKSELMYSGRDITYMVRKIAEQLKGGANNGK